ncbi:MAG: DUF5063 domain-containing protein [Tetrasphaera sp.]
MPEQPQPTPPIAADVAALADLSAQEARVFLETMSEVAAGQTPEASLALALLALSQILVTGARLGAIEDVIPSERYEPDGGPDADLTGLRAGIANTFEGLDEYADLVDPVTSADVTSGSLSNDIAIVAAALDHGLRHYDAGRVLEGLWWWQFSYLSDWGERAAMALRVLHGLISHVRLDADEDLVAEAEFDALHP